MLKSTIKDLELELGSINVKNYSQLLSNDNMSESN